MLCFISECAVLDCRGNPVHACSRGHALVTTFALHLNTAERNRLDTDQAKTHKGGCAACRHALEAGIEAAHRMAYRTIVAQGMLISVV